MSDDEQAMVLDLATHTFRPCCDNSTFFQDCNHGSALLGLLELAASIDSELVLVPRQLCKDGAFFLPLLPCVLAQNTGSADPRVRLLVTERMGEKRRRPSDRGEPHLARPAEGAGIVLIFGSMARSRNKRAVDITMRMSAWPAVLRRQGLFAHNFRNICRRSPQSDRIHNRLRSIRLWSTTGSNRII